MHMVQLLLVSCGSLIWTPTEVFVTLVFFASVSTVMLNSLSKMQEKCSLFLLSRYLFSIDKRTKLTAKHTDIHANV